ncbi:hypothetical protein D3C86_1890370 [compost metagenome]
MNPELLNLPNLQAGLRQRIEGEIPFVFRKAANEAEALGSRVTAAVKYQQVFACTCQQLRLGA